MCLYTQREFNKIFKENRKYKKVRKYKDKNGEFFIFYKRLDSYNYSPYFNTKYKLGWNNSNSNMKGLLERKDPYSLPTQIDKGIHCYTELDLCRTTGYIKVKVYLDDIISFGFFGEVVAKRVYINSFKRV